VGVLPLAERDDPADTFRAHWQQRQDWQRALAEGTATVEEDPFRLKPVVRIYDEQSATLDVRTGLILPAQLTPHANPQVLPAALPEAISDFVLAALPLPVELCSSG